MSKKKQAPAAAPAPTQSNASGGRRPMGYFLPGALLGSLILLAVVGFAYQTVGLGLAESANSGMQVAARALAQQLGGEMAAQQRLLHLAAHDADVIDALKAEDPQRRAAAVSVLELRLKEFMQLRLLPLDWNETDPQGAAPMGYAGVDLNRRAAKSGKAQPAEVHQLKSDAPYVAIVVPIRFEARTMGTLFGALPLKSVRQLVSGFEGLPGRLAVLQGEADNGFRVAGAEVKGGGEVAPVANSIWKVAFQVDESRLPGATGMTLLLGAGGLGVLGILVVAMVQMRMLSGDLRRDLGAVVSLGEAIKKGEGRVSVPRPAMVGFADTLVLLGQYAQDARQRGNGAAPAPVAPALVQGGQQPQAAAQPASTSGGLGIEVETEPATEPLPLEVFRSCDIRGRVGEEIHAAGAHLLGQAFATQLQGKGGDGQVLVARDARLTSQELHEALCQGLMSGGASVVDLGEVPTPMLYFGAHRLGIDSGIVVTGSHNGADINGFKLMLAGSPVAGAALTELHELMQGGALARGDGGYSSREIQSEYLDQIASDVRLGRNLNVVLDGNNGVAGELAAQLLEALGCRVTRVKCEPDGGFPNGPPDPNRPEVLAALELELEANQADLALAFDGDGDRVAVVDERGRFVPPDKVLMLLAQDILIRHPGVDVLYDVASSRHLAGFILSNGGRPVMWKSGHAHMNAKMRETGALLGGEFSGHYYVKERWHGYDDAIYTVARLLEVLTADPRNVSELIDELPSSLSTQEFRLHLEEGQCEALISAIVAQANFPEAKLIDLDGLRVEYPDRWGLVRCAHSEPALVFRFEAGSEGALEQAKEEFRALLTSAVPGLEPPF